MNQNEKIEGFAREIYKNADAIVKKMQTKTARATKEQLDQFSAKAKADFDSRAAYETGRLRTQTNREIARLHADVRRAAVQHREEIVSAVFEKAKSELCAFCRTPEYRDTLEKCIKALASRIGEGATVFVCKRDLPAATDICKDIAGVKDVCASDEISIGLAAVCNSDKTLFLEDTFDSRLRAQRDVFLQESGMTLEA